MTSTRPPNLVARSNESIRHVTMQVLGIMSDRGRTNAAKVVVRALWMLSLLAVVVGSLLAANSAPMRLIAELSINDKIQHFAAYSLLVLLPTLHERQSIVALAVAGALLMGVGLEFAQLYSPGRTFDLLDMRADAFGVSMGLTAGIPLRRAARRWFDGYSAAKDTCDS